MFKVYKCSLFVNNILNVDVLRSIFCHKVSRMTLVCSAYMASLLLNKDKLLFLVGFSVGQVLKSSLFFNNILAACLLSSSLS